MAKHETKIEVNRGGSFSVKCKAGDYSGTAPSRAAAERGRQSHRDANKS